MIENSEQLQKAKELAQVVINALEDKKGLDPTLLEVGKQTVLADFFVICTGTSNTHVKALADEVEFKTNEILGIKPNHVEGFSDNTWTLLDYGTVIVNIFTREGREYYKLEKLWRDTSAEPVKKPE